MHSTYKNTTTGLGVLAICMLMAGLLTLPTKAKASSAKFSELAEDIVSDLHKVKVDNLQARDGYLNPRIAVMPLKAKEGGLTALQADLFNRQFEQALLDKVDGQFVIVSRQALPLVLEEGTRSLRGDDALRRISEMNENSRADILVVGASYNERGAISLSYQALAVESGTLLGATRTIRVSNAPLRVTSNTDVMRIARNPTRREEVALEAETLLYELGYEPGPIDGIITKQTRRALSRYQRDSALPVNGRLTRDVVKNMRRDTR